MNTKPYGATHTYNGHYAKIEMNKKVFLYRVNNWFYEMGLKTSVPKPIDDGDNKEASKNV